MTLAELKQAIDVAEETHIARGIFVSLARDAYHKALEEQRKSRNELMALHFQLIDAQKAEVIQ